MDYMRIITAIKSDCYCAFCKSNRQIYSKKHIDLVNIILALAVSFCLSAGLWAWYDPRVVVIVSFAIVISEAFIYLRWRFSIVCTQCGFDPVLYKKSTSRAKGKVREFY